MFFGQLFGRMRFMHFLVLHVVIKEKLQPSVSNVAWLMLTHASPVLHDGQHGLILQSLEPVL